jgi:Sulfatase
MNFKAILEGFGASALILLPRVWDLLSPNHIVLYHSFLPMQSVVWGTLIDVIFLTLLSAPIFGYLQKRETGFRTIIWALIAGKLTTVIVFDAQAVWQTSFPYFYVKSLFYVALLVTLALCWFRPQAYQRAVRGWRLLLLLAGCSVVWMVPELLYLGLRAQPHDAKVPVTTSELHPVRGSGPGDGRRIVWLLFDELSYDQAFDHRFPGLAMPAFDKLKSESVSFSDLRPAGYYTEQVIPSFFLGHVVAGIRSNLDGELMVKLDNQGGWQAFNPRATLFSDAQRIGWTTGLVGWYNPYCRILAGTLDYCFWRMGDGEWNGTSPENSVLTNAMAPLMERIRKLQHKDRFPQEEKHASDLAAVMSQAKALIREQSIGLVFIHLPVPHPPGIYDRRSGHPRFNGTYIDNLALADRTLAELMETLNATASAGKTTVIVCSDHSWRLRMWGTAPQWTKEEEAASHGRFDPRPVLFIHFPGQSDERDETAPFDEIRIHAIIERMLRGQQPEFDKALLVGSADLPGSARP